MGKDGTFWIDDDGNVVKWWKLLCIPLVLGLILIFNPIVIVNAGERGVVLTWGAVEDRIMNEGMNWRTPIAQDVKIIDVRTQKYEVKAAAASADLQDVSTTVALNYHLDSTRVNKLYQTLGYDWSDRVIVPAIQESVKAATAQYTAEELITKRALVKQKIEEITTARLATYGIQEETISITDFTFSESFSVAIENKVTAEQNALAAKNKLEQVKYEAQQTIEQARGKAEALTIEGKALAENPAIAQLRWIEKWSGTLPLVVSGSGSGFIFDISSFTTPQTENESG